MKSHEEEVAGKIRACLDRATTDLRPGLAYRLQQARAQALARVAEGAQVAGSGRLVGAHGLLGAGAAGGSLPTGGADRPILSAGRLWLGAGVLALVLLGWQQWTAWQELAEVEEVDAQILTSDLPIDAFVDRGFQLFLTVAPTLAEPDAGTPAADAAATEASSDAPVATPVVGPLPEGLPAAVGEPATAKPAE